MVFPTFSMGNKGLLPLGMSEIMRRWTKWTNTYEVLLEDDETPSLDSWQRSLSTTATAHVHISPRCFDFFAFDVSSWISQNLRTGKLIWEEPKVIDGWIWKYASQCLGLGSCLWLSVVSWAQGVNESESLCDRESGIWVFREPEELEGLTLFVWLPDEKTTVYTSEECLSVAWRSC